MRSGRSAIASRFRCPTTSSRDVPYVTFPEGSPEAEYMKARRMELGGFLPCAPAQGRAARRAAAVAFERFLKSTEEREISTTMAFVQILQTLLRDKNIGKRIVPIVPDESRTFGMEGMFRQLGIWNQLGQLYTPQDADQLMFYKESKDGQILQEGINEAGAMCDWIAAATSYSTHGVQMIPFYIFYSMFGFQRVGDLAWAAGDMRSRGFLLGGTAGRTTLNGEGLQHEDGHSHLHLGDGAELHLVRPDVRLRSRGDHPGRPAPDVRRAGGRLLLPDGDERELRRTRRCRRARRRTSSRACTCSRAGDDEGEGAARAAARLGHDLARGDRRGGAAAQGLGRRVRSLELPDRSPSSRATAMRSARWNMLNSTGEAESRRTSRLVSKDTAGPVIAATDYMRAFADQIRAFVPRRYVVLGTDGFGRSDTREKLRRFFEVDRHYIDRRRAQGARRRRQRCRRPRSPKRSSKYGIDAAKPAPWRV